MVNCIASIRQAKVFELANCMLAFGEADCLKELVCEISNQSDDLAFAAHGGLVLGTYPIGDSGYLFYGAVPGVEDGDICTTHDQDFTASNRTEHMTFGVVADSEDLPGG